MQVNYNESRRWSKAGRREGWRRSEGEFRKLIED